MNFRPFFCFERRNLLLQNGFVNCKKLEGLTVVALNSHNLQLQQVSGHVRHSPVTFLVAFSSQDLPVRPNTLVLGCGSLMAFCAFRP
jgi:hypothetical protein